MFIEEKNAESLHVSQHCGNALLGAGFRVLVACEYSGTVRDAFASLGFEAWSCDILETEKPGNHYKGDVRDILKNGWDLKYL